MNFEGLTFPELNEYLTALNQISADIERANRG